jgi:F-type H+-transporting ATPase subunit delta
MLGASRDSMSALTTVLQDRRSDAGIVGLAGDLQQVADLLGREKTLRSALADSGQPSAARRAIAEQVLGGRVGALAVDLTVAAVGLRWSHDDDLVIALETLGAQAAFIAAQDDGTLDATEEEIFRFGRAVEASPELQMALTDPAQTAQAKANLVADLLRDRATAATLTVIGYAVGHLHGRRIDAVLADLADLAAEQRRRVVAVVRVASPLDAEQERRMTAALSRLTGREVRLNVAVDPEVLGGAHVTVGDEVIDGTVASRLEQARRTLLG